MGGFELIVGIVPVVVIVIFIIATSVRILREYERAVIFRFGRRANAVFNPGGDGSGPGLVSRIRSRVTIGHGMLREGIHGQPCSTDRGEGSGSGGAGAAAAGPVDAGGPP